jgi:hypothetical protein
MSADTVFLGIIALATFVMAAIQIAVLVVAAKKIGPIVANARKVSDDAARVSALAVKQAERVDQFMANTAAKVDGTLTAVQSAIAGWFAGRRSKGRSKTDAGDEEENLFIG